jgi:hypothetical protein
MILREIPERFKNTHLMSTLAGVGKALEHAVSVC